MADPREGGIAILDFGSQYTQLIARRVREQNVYAEVFHPDAEPHDVMRHNPKGFILSGGPNSIYDDGSPKVPLYVLEKPTLGICYGMQALTHALDGQVGAATEREYGSAQIMHTGSALFEGLDFSQTVWMSHGDRIESPPPGFQTIAASQNSPFAAIANENEALYGVQFHPEVSHTPQGISMLRNFVLGIAGCEQKWSAAAFIEEAITSIQAQVGDDGRVLLGLSGGVDSAVAGALIQKAIGERLTAVFIDTGLLRKQEAEQVVHVFKDERHMNLVARNAAELFFSELEHVTEPEEKRRVIGRTFIDVFTEEARNIAGETRFLAQGTIYPDVIESAASSKNAKVIKSHHNVGGLPDDLQFELVEPLRDLFKDEVRRVGHELGLPDSIIWRQPFPGPGLAIRCLGDVTFERVQKLREADAIFRDELTQANLLRHIDGVGTSQAFAVLLPVKAVGVMGDNRTYEEVIAIRAVATDDFMTADWARLPYDLLARVSSRIVNEVRGVNRVVYDITSKPPGTIEWE
ncbi:MAG: glutamine-hydrolyzing GMP synthase [Chloroflexota bacterium]